MPLRAMIFDIDGTLVDSNPAHVLAWEASFLECGYKVDRERIKLEIGKGGDKLVPDILGDQADEKDGDRLRKAEPKHFAKLVEQTGLSLFPGALQLVSAVRQRGMKTVLATSSGKNQLTALEKAANIKLEAMFDVMATADDADESKPAPDIVVAAVKKAQVAPEQCAMVGDTLYDAQAAKKAGVTPIGVLTGYQTKEDLLRAGARWIYKDTADLLQHLDAVIKG